MAETKTCNLTKAEIEQLIMWYGYQLGDNTSEKVERINYLHKRFNAFSETENINNAQAAANAGFAAAPNQPDTPPIPPVASAWPTNG